MSTFMRRLLPAWLAAVVLLIPSAARAQFDTATVLGNVMDEQGAAVPGASVTLTNVATGIVATAISESTGAYQFLNVRVGTYRIEAELQGFSKAVVPTVTVTVNARQRVDLTMKVGGIGETVQVTGARMLESESSDRGQVIAHEQIVNLPLNGRAYADLALLSPGVRQSSISSSRDASFNVNGMRSSLNNFILDGVDNNSYGTSNQGFSNQVVQVSPDAVEEFKVQTNNFSAEFGRAGGAVINATFRSGTNDFHGTVWEFNRNTSLNATGFFKPTSGVKPELSRNQYGGVFGGPIVRNRSFFFVNYEGFRQTSSTVTFASIPTMAQRQGQLGRPIVNPLTGAVYADGVIPASAITPFARSVLAGLPEPTRPGTSNNFDSLPERTDDNDKVDVKVDQQFGSQTSAFVRFSHRKVNNFEPPPIPGETSSPSNAFVEVLNQQLALGVTRTLSSRSLLEVRFGAVAHQGRQDRARHRQPEHVRALRHHRAADRGGVRGRPHAAVGDRLDGVGTAEQQSRSSRIRSSVDWRINYSTIAGTHTLKTGYEYQRIGTAVDDVHPKYGSDTYAGQFSRPAGAAADPATYNLADFMFGARNQYDLVNPFVFHLRQRMHFAYLQDDWRVNPALTLNLGLRYEIRDAAVGGRQLPDQLRSGDQHPRPGARRLGLRSRARQRRHQQPRAAHRGRLQPEREDRRPRRLRHRATSSSIGWAARTCCRSTDRTSCRSPSSSSRRRGFAPATRRRRPAFGRPRPAIPKA